MASTSFNMHAVMGRCGLRLGAASACALLLAAAALAAEGPSVAVQDTALYVEVDREAEKLLAAARQAAAAGQWREAIDAYQRVVEFSPPAATQPVASAVPGAAVWLPIQQVAARELCRSLDARGLALYREAHDAPARRDLERALAARDRQGLRQVAARYLATSSGDDALAALGSLAFERGHFVSALAAWRTLLEHCPEPSVSVVAVKARVWACLRALGRTHEADALRRELLADHPQAALRAGGREGTVAEFLAAPPALAADPPLAEWPTLGGRAGHAATAQAIGGVGSRRWTFRVPNALAGDAVPPAVHATVSEGRVFVANEAAVVALDAATGRLAWMYPDAPEEPQPPAPDEAVNAVACDGGRAFARVGGAVVAFHAATGRVLWRHPLREKPAADPPPEPPANAPDDEEAKKDDAPPPIEPALLATPPVVAGGRVIVGLTVLGDEARASLLALDAATGRRLWRTFVCSRTISAFRGLGGTPSVPALDGGTAYFCTNLGAVAAVDAATGRLRWLHRYPAVHTYLRDALVARGWRWHTEPPAVVGGRVVVAPQDAGRLLALEGHDGTTLWTAPRLGARHVVADARGRVFVAGRSVAALDVRTGKRLWAVALPAAARGRPQPVGESLYVCTASQLVAVAVADGAITCERVWQEGELPGNAIVAGGRVVVASDGRVTAYGDWQPERARLLAQHKAAPQDPAPLLRLGTLEATRGRYAAAVAHFQQALRWATERKAAPLAQQARAGLYAACRAIGDEPSLAKALRHASSEDETVAALLAVARLRERHDQWPQAVDAYQRILEQHPAARCQADGGLTVSARALASAEISRVIALHARGVYARQEVRASQQLEQAKAPVAIEAVVRHFPHSEAAERALLRRLSHADARTLAPDLAALARLLAPDAASPKLRQQLDARLAALRPPTAFAPQNLEPLWEVHTRIAHRRVALFQPDGAPEGLLYFAASRLSQGSSYHALECRRPDTGALVWQRQFEVWNRLGLFAGDVLLLASMDELLAVDARSGGLRWQATTADEPPLPPGVDLPPAAPLAPLRWRNEHARIVALATDAQAAYAGLAGGKVVARSLETGRPLWSRQLDARQFLTNGLIVRDGVVWACVAYPAAVHRLDAKTGNAAAPIKLGGLDPRITDRPAVHLATQSLYLVLGDRAVHVIDLAMGRELWSRQVGFGIREVVLSADGRRCYVVPSSFTADGEIVSLDPATGDLRRRRSLRIGTLVDAVLGPHALYVAERNRDRDLVVQALDPDDLGLRWQTVPFGISHVSRLAVGPGVVGLTGRQGQDPVALLIDPATGRLVADKKPAGALRLSIGLADGLLCIGSDRGLFAFGPPDGRLDERIAALQARVRAGHRPSLSALANALYRRGREPQAMALLDRGLRDEALLDSEYATLKDQLNSLRESLARRQPAILRTPRLAVRPKIDGSIDEPWRPEGSVRLDGPTYIHEVQGRPTRSSRWRSPSDLSATLYTAWDERRFYFAIDVTDDIHRTYTGQQDTWVGDGLIITIDATNDGGYGYTFSGRDVLLTLALTRKDERREDRDEDSTPEGEYRVRRKDDNSGTVYEVAVPWDYLGVRPRPGLRFGFNITVTDDDGDQATKAVSWSPGMILDQRRSLMIRGFTPALFGDILLTGPPPTRLPPPPPARLRPERAPPAP